MKKLCLQACIWALAVPVLFFAQGAAAVVVTETRYLGDGLPQVGGAPNGAIISSNPIGSVTYSFTGLDAAVAGTGGTITITTGPCGGGLAGPFGDKYADCNYGNQSNAGIDIGSGNAAGPGGLLNANADDSPTSGQLDEYFGVTLKDADDSFGKGTWNCFGQNGGSAITGCDETMPAGNNQNYEFSLVLTVTDVELAALLSGGEFDVVLDFANGVAHHNEGDQLDVSLNYTAVPIPAALPLFASGLIGLGLVARRKKKKAA